MTETTPLASRFLNVLAVALNCITIAAVGLIVLTPLIGILFFDLLDREIAWIQYLWHPGTIMGIPALVIVVLVNYLVFGRVSVWSKLQTSATRRTDA